MQLVKDVKVSVLFHSAAVDTCVELVICQIIIIIITIIIINCNLVITWWQWLFYMYTNMEEK